MNRVRIVAPSGVVEWADLELGIARLRRSGVEVRMGDGVGERDFIFAGTDDRRAREFWAAAWEDDTDIVWPARGGYGAARILPELERLTLEQGTPPKRSLAGFSDITALHEFVRSRWGWRTVHCQMPGARAFLQLTDAQLEETLRWLRGEPVEQPAVEDVTLHAYGAEVLNDLEGTLVGGNLTVLTSLVGTSFAMDNAGGRILFLEDVGEAPYRLDRYVRQLQHSGSLRGVRAILLGTFVSCTDVPAGTEQGKPVRPAMAETEWMNWLWGTLSRETGIPILGGLPVGHGPGDRDGWPLPLGGKVIVRGDGRIQIAPIS